MPRQRRVVLLSAMILALMSVVGRTSAQEQRAEVTIKGNVLCNRATDRKPWSWDPKDGDHTPIIYPVEGTPAIAEQVRKIMEGYPDRGLDVEDALAIQDQFDKHLKYFLSPGPIAEKIHKDVEAGSRLLALTGTISERDGKRWITVSRYEPAQVNYPEKMVAPDRPFAPTGGEPLRAQDRRGADLEVHPPCPPAGSSWARRSISGAIRTNTPMRSS